MIMTAVIYLDYPNLLVGALLGAFAGFGVAWFAAWLSRPRIKHYGFVRRMPDYEGGHLHKLWFELKGRSAPGLCSLELTCEERSRFAKWDESASPLTNRQSFWPEMVPGTAMQALHLGRIYCVPLIYEKDGELSLFSGWWYGRLSFPDAVPAVDHATTIRVALTGQGLTWNHEFRVGGQICAGPPLTNADSDAHQGALRRYVDQQESAWSPVCRTASPSAYSRAGGFPRIGGAPGWALNRLRSGPR
jgi:hypothetical protein